MTMLGKQNYTEFHNNAHMEELLRATLNEYFLVHSAKSLYGVDEYKSIMQDISDRMDKIVFQVRSTKFTKKAQSIMT